MLATFELTPRCKELCERSQQLLDYIFTLITQVPEEVTLPREKEFRDEFGVTKDYFFLKEGYLKCEVDGKELFFLETGDLYGVGDFFQSHKSRLFSEFIVNFARYDRKAFSEEISSSKELSTLWTEYLECVSTVYLEMVASLSQEQADMEPDTLIFEPGTKIVVEGDEGDDVYSLLDGVADVFVREKSGEEKKVGEVLSGETFGAMAALTGSARSATVVAKETCLVMAVSKENFIALLQRHPQTAMKLVEDMSRRILALNQKLLE